MLIEFVHSCDNDRDIFTKNTTSEIHHQHSEKLIWTKEEYKSEARRITTGRVLRSMVNQSSTMTTMTDNTMTTMTNNIMTDNTMTTMTDNTMTDNTMKEMPTYDRAIRNMKSRTTDMFRGANRFGVLEDSDEECTKNKVQNVQFANERE